MALRNELHNMNEEIDTGRRQVASQKTKIVEALSRWKEEMEAEKVECEEEIAERERFKELLGGPLRKMAELLDSNWLHTA
jgi:predicted  nucleic acid-binding Zn-ribbon protein